MYRGISVKHLKVFWVFNSMYIFYIQIWRSYVLSETWTLENNECNITRRKFTKRKFSRYKQNPKTMKQMIVLKVQIKNKRWRKIIKKLKLHYTTKEWLISETWNYKARQNVNFENFWIQRELRPKGKTLRGTINARSRHCGRKLSLDPLILA